MVNSVSFVPPKYKLKLIYFIWLFYTLPPHLAQCQSKYKNAFTVKFFGLSFHLKESPYAEIFLNRLDDKGYLVLNIGGIVGYERFVMRDRLSIRIEQGLYADCASATAGFTHIG